MIYFAQAVGGGPVKVGCSSNVPARLKQLEAHYGKPLALLAEMDGGPETEREIHARFAHLRLGRTEQFRPEGDLMAFIGRPLFVNQGDVELMSGGRLDREVIIHLKGTPAYAAWLDDVNRKTHIPKAVIFRLAMADWAKNNGHPKPPEM